MYLPFFFSYSSSPSGIQQDSNHLEGETTDEQWNCLVQLWFLTFCYNWMRITSKANLLKTAIFFFFNLPFYFIHIYITYLLFVSNVLSPVLSICQLFLTLWWLVIGNLLAIGVRKHLLQFLFFLMHYLLLFLSLFPFEEMLQMYRLGLVYVCVCLCMCICVFIYISQSYWGVL